MSAAGSQKRIAGTEREIYSFTFTLANVPDDHEAVANKLFECGCSDAFMHASNGQIFLDFDRAEENLWDAISSALTCVEDCGLGIRVIHIATPGESTIQDFNAWLQVRDKADRFRRQG